MYSYRTNRNYIQVTPLLDRDFDDLGSNSTFARRAEQIPGTRRNLKTDWRGLRERAASGVIPAPDVRIAKDRRTLFHDIRRSAAAGDVQTLRNIQIGEYNSTVRALKRYRDLCVLALDTKEKMHR